MRRIGPYELQDIIGQGGMGTVFRARHVELGSLRAIKVLTALNSDKRATARFSREAQALAQVRHPNVVTIHEVGHDGSPWFAMDLVVGRPLDQLLTRGRLPLERALDIISGVCAGVDALHAHGVVHRDLKPANVIVREDGQPVVVDLGLALAPDRDERLTRTGGLAGTPLYMAPEQVGGKEITPRTDVHALGLILFELLTGSTALGSPGGSSVAHIVATVLASARPVPSELVPDLPLALDRVCARAMASDPALRHARASELQAAIVDARAAPGPTRRQARRRRVALGGAAALLAATAGVGVASAILRDAARGEVAPIASVAIVTTDIPALARRELTEVRRSVAPDQHMALAQSWLRRFPGQAGEAEVRGVVSKLRHDAPLARLKHGLERTAAVFLGEAQDRIVTGGTDGVLRVWRASAEAPEGWAEEREVRVSDKKITELALAPDRRSLAVVVDWAEVSFVDPLAEPPRIELLGPGAGATVAYSPDGSRLAMAHWVTQRESHVAIVGRHPPHIEGELGPLASPIHQIVWAGASRLLVAIGDAVGGKSGSGTLLPDQAVVAFEGGVEVWRLPHMAEVSCVAVSAKGWIAAGTTSGGIVLLGPGGPQDERRDLEGLGVEGEVGELSRATAHSGGVERLAFSPDGTRLFSGSSLHRGRRGGELRRWSIPDGRPLGPASPLASTATFVVVSADGKLILTSTSSGEVQLWSAED